MIQFEIRSTK